MLTVASFTSISGAMKRQSVDKLPNLLHSQTRCNRHLIIFTHGTHYHKCKCVKRYMRKKFLCIYRTFHDHISIFQDFSDSQFLLPSVVSFFFVKVLSSAQVLFARVKTDLFRFGCASMEQGYENVYPIQPMCAFSVLID